MAERYNSNLVWIDLEMTGLNPEIDVILEISTIITSNNLEIIANGPTLAINQPEEILLKMDDWCKKTHIASGLVKAVKESIISLEIAENQTLEFIKKYTNENEAPICGNSIWQDRRFLRKYMTKIDNHLHYRIIDVSSIKEAINRWYPDSTKSNYVKPEPHRAFEDIVFSIEELKHYKKFFFLPD